MSNNNLKKPGELYRSNFKDIPYKQLLFILPHTNARIAEFNTENYVQSQWGCSLIPKVQILLTDIFVE